MRGIYSHSKTNKAQELALPISVLNSRGTILPESRKQSRFIHRNSVNSMWILCVILFKLIRFRIQCPPLRDPSVDFELQSLCMTKTAVVVERHPLLGVLIYFPLAFPEMYSHPIIHPCCYPWSSQLLSCSLTQALLPPNAASPCPDHKTPASKFSFPSCLLLSSEALIYKTGGMGVNNITHLPQQVIFPKSFCFTPSTET